jgi:hypothetical protein
MDNRGALWREFDPAQATQGSFRRHFVARGAQDSVFTFL